MDTIAKVNFQLLEVFKLGICNGIIERKEIIRWADQIILDEDEPAYFVIELSLAKNSNEIISIIKSIIGENTNNVSARIILGLLYKKMISKAISFDNARFVMYSLLQDSGLTKSECSSIYFIDNEYDLAVSGYSKIESVNNEILQFLESYKDFTIENISSWPELNEKIELKIQQDILEIEKQKSLYQETKQKPWWKFW